MDDERQVRRCTSGSVSVSFQVLYPSTPISWIPTLAYSLMGGQLGICFICEDCAEGAGER